MNFLNQKKGSRRKAIRYLRWTVKIGFLLALLLPIKWFSDADLDLPVYSLANNGLSHPLFSVPYSQSICSILLVNWKTTDPGTWITCPLGGIEVLLTAGNEPMPGLNLPYLILSVIAAISIFLISVILLGALFCSWVCPMGTMIDGFDKGVERFMPKTNKNREERLSRNQEKRGSICPTCFLGNISGKLKNNKHATAANGILITAFVGSVILRFPLFCTICPIGITTRGMFHLKAWTNLTKVMMPIMIEFWIIPAFAILLSLREKRYWCRKMCPLGALIKLVSKLNPFMKPVKGDNCMCPPDYKACQKACPQGLGPQKKGSADCTKCFECYATCKNNNVKIKRFETPDAILSLKRFFKNKVKKPKNNSQ